MYFQLLYGIHSELGTIYKVRFERDSKSQNVKVTDRPIIHSDQNLVELFGADKFRALSDEQAAILLAEKGERVRAASPPIKPEELALASDKVQMAAQEGAKGLKPQQKKWLRDVTKRFPAAEKCGLKVMLVKAGQYDVVDEETAEILNGDEPLGKADVPDFIDLCVGV